jgi:hypothetical protein
VGKAVRLRRRAEGEAWRRCVIGDGNSAVSEPSEPLDR